MKKQQDYLGIFLACVTGFALLMAILARAFFPRLILPRLSGGNLVLLSLIALVLDHYLAKGSRRNFRLIPVYGALVFGIFPFAAGFTAPVEALILALVGAALFTLVTWLFDAILDRLSSGPVVKIAPLASAAGLYLAAQCLMGIF